MQQLLQLSHQEMCELLATKEMVIYKQTKEIMALRAANEALQKKLTEMDSGWQTPDMSPGAPTLMNSPVSDSEQ